MLLKQNDRGPDVGHLHQLLIEAGRGIDRLELTTSFFGPSTLTAVLAIQTAHRLRQDGIVGPDTLAALEGGPLGAFTVAGWRCSPSEARGELSHVLQWAVGKIGMQEQPPGSNRSPEIDRWAQEAGVPLGSPWCALFVSNALLQMPSGSPLGWKASAYKIKEWGAAHGRLLAPAETQPGDVWGILRADLHGHVGLTAARVDGGKIASVEGNSGNATRGFIRDPSTLTFAVRIVG